jgi:hypothetical protein
MPGHAISSGDIAACTTRGVAGPATTHPLVAVAVARNPDLLPDPNRLGGHLLVGHHCAKRREYLTASPLDSKNICN